MNKRIQSQIESKNLLNGKLLELFEAYAALNINAEDKSINELKKENLILIEIAKTTLLYIRSQEIIESEVPTGAGSPPNNKNQEILEDAYNAYWDKYEKAPNEPEWLNWLEKPEYDPIKKYIVAAETQFARTKNGWGKEKVRKDLAKFKSVKHQMLRLLEKIHSTK